MRWRDQADRVSTALLENIGHGFLLARLVLDDGGAQLLQFFAFLRIGVQGEAEEGVVLGVEVRVGEEEFGDEEAGLAVGGGDADFARHGELDCGKWSAFQEIEIDAEIKRFTRDCSSGYEL